MTGGTLAPTAGPCRAPYGRLWIAGTLQRADRFARLPGPHPRTGRTHSPPATERPWPMSPEEVETAMRSYEVMVILDSSLEERTVEPSLDKYLNVVRKDGGSVESVDIWGRRRLAYEINKQAEGIYAVVS